MTTYPADLSTHFDAARTSFDALVDRLMDERSGHGELERLIDEDGREIMRQLLQGHLSLRADVEARAASESRPEATGADGAVRTHVKRSARRLGSIFGPVFVERMALSARGVNGALRPLDAELNLPPGLYSHGVRRRVARAAANAPFDQVVTDVRANTGSGVAKRQALRLVTQAAVDFDAFYAHQPLAETVSDDLLVLTFDGKGIMMRPDALRESTRRKAEKAEARLGRRRSPGEKPRRRMAQVAAVYDLQPHARTPASVLDGTAAKKRPRPRNKRVWASLEKPVSETIFDAVVEAGQRDPDFERRWVVLVDGNAHQLDLIERWMADVGVQATVIVDFIHVVEYLWKASWALHEPGDDAAEVWVEGHIQRLLAGRVSSVIQALRQSATKRALSGAKAKAMEDAARYLENHKDYLRYDAYLADGLPIATGVIEGACRHLVKDRMDRTGARWGLEGAEAVLRLRALQTSGDLERYQAFHERRELQRNHLDHYAANDVMALRRGVA